MDVAQFAKALDVPLSEPVIAMFQALDSDEDGTIDFKEFLIGLTFVSSNTNTEDGIEILFEALDPENTGKISAESLEAVLSKVFRRADKRLVQKLMKKADKKETGMVDKEMFAEFIKANPEVLVIGLNMKDTYKTNQRPISLLNKQEAEHRSEDIRIQINQ